MFVSYDVRFFLFFLTWNQRVWIVNTVGSSLQAHRWTLCAFLLYSSLSNWASQMKTATTLQLLRFNHPPSSRWATHRYISGSRWKQQRPPSVFHLFLIISFYFLFHLLFFKSSVLPPSVLLTSFSTCPHSFLSYCSHPRLPPVLLSLLLTLI